MLPHWQPQVLKKAFILEGESRGFWSDLGLAPCQSGWPLGFCSSWGHRAPQEGSRGRCAGGWMEEGACAVTTGQVFHTLGESSGVHKTPSPSKWEDSLRGSPGCGCMWALSCTSASIYECVSLHTCPPVWKLTLTVTGWVTLRKLLSQFVSPCPHFTNADWRGIWAPDTQVTACISQPALQLSGAHVTRSGRWTERHLSLQAWGR